MRLVLALLVVAALAQVAAPAASPVPVTARSAPNFEIRINGGPMRYTGRQPLTSGYSYTIGRGSGSLGGPGRSTIRLDHLRSDLTARWAVFRLGRVVELSGGSVNGDATTFATLRARVTRSTWGRCPRGRQGTVTLFDGGLLQPDRVTLRICGFVLEYRSGPFSEVGVTIGEIATTEPPSDGTTEPF